jgi:flavin-dependent dehydrogenase
MIKSDYDVVVIGGGPAGSTVSTLLAQQGVRVGLFERERFPRFHIGESLIPETYWVLKRLDMLPKMQASPFVKKYSVQFVNSVGKESRAWGRGVRGGARPRGDLRRRPRDGRPDP